MQPRCTLTQIGNLIANVLRDLGPALRGYPVRLALDQQLPPVDVDVTLISRVLTNMVENAIRHAPKGTPITVGAAPGPAGTVVVSVADHGPGVASSDATRSSACWHAVSTTPSTGLGLSIAKAFVEAHRQRIWVDDAPGGGARFCFTVPCAELAEEEQQVAAGAHS